jgi:hypothetical protein
MEWDEVLLAFIVSHMAGDFLLQTDWQARHKWGGLGRDPVARRALVSHVGGYGLAFVPAFVWLATDIGVAALGMAALVLLPHLIQDDGRLVLRYTVATKKAAVEPGSALFVLVDQSFHLVALTGAALVAVA